MASPTSDPRNCLKPPGFGVSCLALLCTKITWASTTSTLIYTLSIGKILLTPRDYISRLQADNLSLFFFFSGIALSGRFAKLAAPEIPIASAQRGQRRGKSPKSGLRVLAI